MYPLVRRMLETELAEVPAGDSRTFRTTLNTYLARHSPVNMVRGIAQHANTLANSATAGITTIGGFSSASSFGKERGNAVDCRFVLA